LENHKSFIIIRLILCLSFLGHGLVSLGLSPSIELHLKLIDSVNFTSISNESLILLHAIFDIGISFLLILNKKIEFVLKLIISYLVAVSLVAVIFYLNQTESIFGFAEIFRRLPWIFFALLSLRLLKSRNDYFLLRFGLAFAFLAHGLASLGFFGLKQGHIDLALNIIPQDKAQTFVFYSGISDTLISLLLFIGIKVRLVSFIGMLWIAFIVYLSYLTALPDAIFRFALVVAAAFLFFERRAHYFLMSKSKIL